MTKPGFESRRGDLYMIHALTNIMWIYNIWDQFEKLKKLFI